jgi:hypothetical protein
MAEQTEEPLYAVALLRIALDLKRTDRPLDELIRDTATRMRLDEPAFRAYLAQHEALQGMFATQPR